MSLNTWIHMTNWESWRQPPHRQIWRQFGCTRQGLVWQRSCNFDASQWWFWANSEFLFFICFNVKITVTKYITICIILIYINILCFFSTGLFWCVWCDYGKYVFCGRGRKIQKVNSFEGPLGGDLLTIWWWISGAVRSNGCIPNTSHEKP